MNKIDKDIISVSLSERDENLYDVVIYFNLVKHMAVYSPIVGIMFCSLPQNTKEDQEILLKVSNEIKKVLKMRRFDYACTVCDRERWKTRKIL